MNKLYYQGAGAQFEYRHQLVDQSDVSSQDFKLCIGPLDQYRFRRQHGVDLAQVTANALRQLRQQYGMLRLFYSGGLDSHFILHHCLINSVHLDEIYSVVKTPFESKILLALDESINAAQSFLQQTEISEKLTRTRIVTPKLSNDFFNRFYSSDDYWKYNFGMTLIEPARTCNVIDEFGIGATDACNLVGIDTPFVYWDQGWQFCYVDQQIVPEHVSQHGQSCYSLSTSVPEFVEAYVNVIVDQMEKHTDYRNRFSWSNVLQYRSKFIQRMLPEMQHINGQTWGLRFPKNSGVPTSPDATYMEKVIHGNFRSFIYWQYAQQEKPAWLDRWIHYTDWEWVERCQKFGGVFSNKFILHD